MILECGGVSRDASCWNFFGHDVDGIFGDDDEFVVRAVHLGDGGSVLFRRFHQHFFASFADADGGCLVQGRKPVVHDDRFVEGDGETQCIAGCHV